MYELLQQCRSKLATEASQRTVHLRILVGHANMIDVLLEGVEIHEAYLTWLTVREERRKIPPAARRYKRANSIVRSCNNGGVATDDGDTLCDGPGIGVQHVEFSVSCQEVEPDE